MALGRSKRSIKKIVGILSDPHPEFVSLVSYPASQTPWKVVKSEDPDALRRKSVEMATRAASSVVDIHEIVFTKTAFSTTKAVTDYMEANGYENFQVEDKGDFWLVPGRKSEELEDGLETIDAGKGIKMTLGRLRPARKSAEQPAAAPEKSQKSVYSVSSFANVISDIAYLLSDAKYEAEYEGDNSLVPGKLQDWLKSGVAIFKEMATEEVDELVERITSQKSELMARRSAPETQENPVADATPPAEAPKDDQATPAAAPEAAPTAAPAATATEQTAGAPAETVAAPNATPEASTETLAAQAETPPAAPAEPAPEAAPATAEELSDEEKALKAADPVGYAITKALGKMGETIGTAVAKAVEPVQKSLTELREQVTKTAERVDVVETATRQTRQSGDNAEVSVPSTQAAPAKDEKARKHADRLHRDRLGF